MTILDHPQPTTAGRTRTEDRAAYVAYIRSATILAELVSSHDRIKRDMNYAADRATEAINRRADDHRRALAAFRTARAEYFGATS